MKRLLTLLALTVVVPSAKAADIYFSQAGGGTGASCASPRALSSHVIGDDVAGNVLHICGTITGSANTTALTLLASGTSGNRITVKGESGNLFTAPYWSLTGAINLNGKSFITVDSVNIQNTANGTGLANSAGSYGIYSAGGHDITIQNSTISNICLKTTGASAGCSTSNVQADGIFINGGGNFNINHNTIHDAHWLIFMGFPTAATTTGWDVGFNTLYNADHMIACGDTNAGGTLSGPKFHDNDMHDMVNWDGSSGFHHDYFHCFTGFNGGASTITGLQFYNNYMHGDPGASLTAFVNFENNTGNTYSNGLAYNNVMTNSSTTHLPGNGYFSYGGSGHSFYNNSINGSSTSQGVSNACFYNGGNATGALIKNNLCQTVGLGVNNISNGGIPFADFNDWFNVVNFYQGGFLSFASWKTACSCDSNSFQTTPNVQTVPPFTPNSSSSPLVLTATNLSGLGVTALNSDINNVTRPPLPTKWDVGAAQFVSVLPPNAPTGLTGSVSGSTVSLSWTASSGTPIPTGYSLYRGTVHGGPYTLVKTALTTTSTTDTPANGTYFYTVAAFTGGLISTISGNGSVATVTCMTACPSFGNGTSFTIGGNSTSGFNGTFTSTGQPTNATFTFNSTTNSIGSGGAAWPTAQESVKSNEVSATVPAALSASISPASRTFGSFTVGVTSPSQSFTYTNTSGPGSNTTITGFAFTTGNTTDFSASTPCGATPITVASSASCVFNVSFTPTAAGARSATFAVTDNTPSSPHSATVTGTGVAAAPGVNLNPTSLAFGEQTLSTTSSVRSIILTNTGTGTLNITSVVASGDFAVVTVPATNCGGSLASLATCSLNVTFTPTATGGRTGAVTVTDNAAGSPHVATLSGTGITTKCAITGNVTLSGAGSVCQ